MSCTRGCPSQLKIYVRTDCNLHVALPLYSDNRRCPLGDRRAENRLICRLLLVADGHFQATAVLKGLLLNIATLRRPHSSPRSSSRSSSDNKTANELQQEFVRQLREMFGNHLQVQVEPNITITKDKEVNWLSDFKKRDKKKLN